MSEQNEDFTNVMKKDELEWTVYEVLPIGLYPGKITAISEVVGDYGPQYKFEFDVYVKGAIMPHKITGWASKKLSAKSKLGGWATSLFPDQVGPGFKFVIQDWVNMDVLLKIGTGEAKPDGSVFNTIEDVMRPMVAVAAAGDQTGGL